LTKNLSNSWLSQFWVKANTSGLHHPWDFLDVQQISNASWKVFSETSPMSLSTLMIYLSILKPTMSISGYLIKFWTTYKCTTSKSIKCFFGNREVSYLGFTLTPEGIKPGKNKLKAIKDTKPPTNVKTIRSFIGVCNFFRTHIKNFAIIAAPLFKLMRKDSGYKGGPLPKEAMDAFCILKNSLVSEPVIAFPRADCQYALITDAATGTADTTGGLGAILMQKDQFDNFYAFSYTSRQLKDHKKLLTISPGVCSCCVDVFNEYLKGKKFILFTDHKPLEKMGHLHTKL
jgi:hypothetical protein